MKPLDERILSHLRAAYPNVDFAAYITHLESCNGTDYLHHTLPKSEWPEYKDLKRHSWNGTLLSYTEHVEAHRILSALVPDNSRFKYAYLLMSNQSAEAYSEASRKRKRHNARPEVRAAQSQLLKTLHSTPEFAEANRVRMSKRMRDLHKDPEFVAKRNARCSTMRRKTPLSNSERKRARETMQRLRSDPAFVQRLNEARDKKMADPKHRAVCREAMAARQHTRWHVNRGTINADCSFCNQSLTQAA